MNPRERFFGHLSTLHEPYVLDMGSKAWHGLPPRHHKEELRKYNSWATWVGTDVEAGEGVEIVADAHNLSGSFHDLDAIICASVLEHVKRPWIVAEEMAKATKPGGWAYIETHQSFPLHGYPFDYFRFSVEALCVLFGPEAGWKPIDSAYYYPCRVVPIDNGPHTKDWNFTAPAHLNVAIIAERIAS